MSDDPLNVLEGFTQQEVSNAGETPPGAPQPEPQPRPTAAVKNDADTLDDRLPDALKLAQKPARVPDDLAALKTGFDLVADTLPVSEHKALGQWVMTYGVKGDDPTWGNYLAGNVSFNSAMAAQKSAEIIIQGAEKIPKLVQDAFLNAERDVRADLHKIFAFSGGDFVNKIRAIITDSADAGAEKLRGAASVLDSELTRKIEIRKTEGVDLWVAKAVEAADVALAKQKIINFYFLSFGIVGLLTVGGVIGAVLEA
ncbi:hypothetical protein OW716_14740, partial [Acidithiobacillus ferriphilus]